MTSMEKAKHTHSPTEMHDRTVRREVKRAATWLGMAALIALVVVLIEPILLIIAGALIAVMLDGGTRLLGKAVPLPRGLRLTIVTLGVVGFLLATVVLLGYEITAQVGQLREALTVQGDRLSALASRYDIIPDNLNVSMIGQQLGRSMGAVTAALGTAFSAITTLFLIFIIGLFIAIEPNVYVRGAVWLFPRDGRDEALLLFQRMGMTMRRLFAGRLLGMVAEGVLTWVALSFGNVPVALLLGILSGILAFIPNIGAFITGVLMVAVGFSAGVDTGLWAIGTYVVVQTFDGYILIPYVAKKTVDLPPALTLSMQVLFSTLFGLIGLALADPITAILKLVLERSAEREAEEEGDAEVATADLNPDFG